MATINWQDVITSAVATVGGGGACVLSAAWVIKAVITDRLKANADAEIERVKNALAREAEAFKIHLKADADAEIERVKAHLTRALRVHERQSDVLTKLHKHFYEAHGFFQRMTTTGVTGDDKTRQEYRDLTFNAMASAHAELSTGRLSITSTLAQQCDTFFKTMREGQVELDIFYHPMASGGEQHAKFWDRAQAIAFEDLPRLLKEIEESARSIIHDGQDNPTA